MNHMDEFKPCQVAKENGTLQIELPSRLDAKNAASVAQVIFGLLDGEIRSIKINARHLKRISPDGLDVILELRKKCRDITVENASMGISDTLESYGFHLFVGIKKQYRFVSVKDCEVIGKGGHGKIFKVGEDTIIKVFTDNSTIEDVERERRFARYAFMHGVPTPITYDVVETELGYGVLFEILNGTTLGKFLTAHPEKFDEYSEKFAGLLCTLNSIEADEDIYPDFVQVYHDRADHAKKYITDSEAETMKRIIDAVPRGTTMIHGDYHPNNVMIDSSGELMIIDMADISRGNGFFDIGGTYTMMKFVPAFPVLNKICMPIMSITPKMALRMWDVLLKKYYGTTDEEKLALYNTRCQAFGMMRIAGNLGMVSARPELLSRIMAKFIKYFIVPREKKYIEIFSGIENPGASNVILSDSRAT